ncbi:MAG TPA: LLM class flavin-dependent oxidoreductase, partial [Anaerolineales bacterium]|nr:LLM class flavin-dependent oxidoreductase [Anaerolineales bacterium]
FIATSSKEIEFARQQIAFYASTPSYRAVMSLHGWDATAEKLSALAARGGWNEMPALVTDEILNEFCLVTDEKNLANELKQRYNGIADRLALYSPFVPNEKDNFWKQLAQSLR